MIPDLLRQFIGKDDGTTAVEYGMLAGLFAVAILGWASVAGDDILANFTIASDTLDNAPDTELAQAAKKGGD